MQVSHAGAMAQALEPSLRLPRPQQGWEAGQPGFQQACSKWEAGVTGGHLTTCVTTLAPERPSCHLLGQVHDVLARRPGAGAGGS